ncbi:MAG: polyprenyl synthetase family protein [Pseudomonadota bacterium]
MANEHVLTAEQADTELTAAPTVDIDKVLALGAADMRRVDRCIRAALTSEVVLVNQVAEYIVGSGGKRLRPLLLCLAARACGHEGEETPVLAAIIEFIHTATLLHDDVVDESDTRRGRRSAHAVWGNSAAVLVGDFLYSRSFQLMVTLNEMRIMEILADTTNTIAEGEVLQLLNLGDPEVSEMAYYRVIDNKTAKLFEAAGRLAAVVAGQGRDMEEALAGYGARLGRAFQIADDLLDYAGDADALGKNVGDDLAEGKPTLPLIFARERATTAERALIDEALAADGADLLDQVLDIIRRTGALASTAEAARNEAQGALELLDCLPASAYRDALAALARYSHERTR